MKKFLGILVLGLLWCNVGFAEKANLNKLKFSKDITKGYNILREYGERSKGWYWPKSFLKHMRTKPAGDHLLHIVKKSDGYPVRFGEESLRFEVRAGDSWASDVEINGVPRNRERSEMIICCMKGNLWHTWSIFLPKDFPNIFPAKTALGQFHNNGDNGDNPVEFQFNNYANRFDPKKSGGYWVMPAETISSHVAIKILEQEDLLGKWTDILINSKFTHKKDGFLKVWVNGKLSYEFKGRTHLKKDIIEQEIGIYRSYIHRRPGPEPIQIAYFDEIRFAKSCKKLKIKDLGYSCKALEGQNVIRIDTIADDGNNKKQKIIKVLTVRIASKIAREVSNPNLKEIKKWVFKKLTTMDWDDNLEKLKDRRPTQERLLKNGIKEFAM